MNILNGIPYEAFFAIYLIIACNFIGELFGCKFRQMLQENMYLKHLFGFLILSFLVILVGIDINDANDVIKGVFYSIIFYIWFVLTTKTHIYITIFVLIIFLTMYIISIKIKKLEKEKEKEKKNVKKYKLINNILLLVAFVITIIGVINYLILKKKENIKRKIPFSYKTFFLGKQKCRNDKIENIDLVNNIKFAKLI